MYQSAVLLDYHTNSIEVELQLPQSRLTQAIGFRMNAADLETHRAALSRYLAGGIRVVASDGRPFAVSLEGTLSLRTIDGAPYLVAHLVFLPPDRASLGHLELTDNVILGSLPGQIALVSTRSDWNSRTYANDPQLVGVLRSEERSLPVDRGEGSWFHGFRSIFHLGVRHIAEGTDHLLFLLALLLPAPLLVNRGRWGHFAGVRHGLTQILKVVTAFTLGHSVTLALGASGIVHVPEAPIEMLIAVSILVSAIHALRPLFPGREAVVAACFGLVHGLAFASTLGELGLTRWERVASIFGFNLGIEAMQLCVVAAIMPSLMLLSRTRVYPAFRSVGAIFAGTAALGWILDRSFGIAGQTDIAVNAIAHRAPWLAIVLFLLALGLNLMGNLPTLWRQSDRTIQH